MLVAVGLMVLGGLVVWIGGKLVPPAPRVESAPDAGAVGLDAGVGEARVDSGSVLDAGLSPVSVDAGDAARVDAGLAPSPAPPNDGGVQGALYEAIKALVALKQFDEAWTVFAKDFDDWKSKTPMNERVASVLLLKTGMVKGCDVGVDDGVAARIDRLVPSGDAQRQGLARIWGEMSRRCHKAREIPKAHLATQKAWMLDDTEVAAFVIEAKIAFDENRIETAISTLEKGLARNRGERELQTLLEEMREKQRQLGTKLMLSSAHFNLLYTSRDEEAEARWTLKQLDDAWEAVGDLFGIKPAEPIAAVMQSDSDFFASRHTNWASGFYDGKIRVTAGGSRAQSSFSRGVMFHEYAHHLYRLSTGSTNDPAWLNEGLAQRAERLGDPHPDEPCATAHAIRLRQLHQPFGALPANVARIAYLVADHAAARVIEKYGWDGARRLLKELQRTPEFGEAFERTFSIPYVTYAEAFDKEAER